MKKALKLTLLTLTFALFSSICAAQSTAKEDAMSQTKKLQEFAKFESDVFKLVYEAYVKYNTKLESINSSMDKTSSAYKSSKGKLVENFKNTMEPLLNADQFKIFLDREKLN